MKIEKGMKYKVVELKNPLINTEVGNIVEIVNVGKSTVEFKDMKTSDYGLIEKEKIAECFEAL